MSSTPEDARLMALAGSIDDGEPIDWDAAERNAATDAERAAVQQLRVVAGIASVCRDPEAGLPRNSGSLEVSASPEPLGRWGSHVLLEEVGVGAYGRVYRAFDEKLGREVALKLFATGHDAPADAARVLREGRLLARVEHPNVVRVYAADEYDGRVGLSMKFVDGFTLEEELEARGVFGAREARSIGIELCRALAAVHGAGLLHRDIKTQNAMRDYGGQIVLMDLGAGLEVMHTNLSEAGGPRGGTPIYLAPELLDGGRGAPASDIYSLGVLLFHLVTDRYPIEGTNLDEIRAAHAGGPRLHLRDLRPDLDPEFVHVVERAVDPDPARRYQTAGELERALAPTMTPPEPSPVAGATSATAPHRTFQPWRWATASVLLLTLAGAASWRWFPELWMPARPLVQAAQAGDSDPRRVTAGVPAAVPAAPGDTAPYTIETSFHRFAETGESPLVNGSTVRLGDQIGVSLRATRDVYVYVVTEDSAGDTFLLFPLPGQSVANPLAKDRLHRLPGIVEGVDSAWEVTTSSGADHFLLFVSPTRLDGVEQTLLADLPAAAKERRVASARLSEASLGLLRGVGGLSAVRPGTSGPKGRLSQIAARLTSPTEQANGVWVRQVTFENPAGRVVAP